MSMVANYAYADIAATSYVHEYVNDYVNDTAVLKKQSPTDAGKALLIGVNGLVTPGDVNIEKFKAGDSIVLSPNIDNDATLISVSNSALAGKIITTDAATGHLVDAQATVAGNAPNECDGVKYDCFVEWNGRTKKYEWRLVALRYGAQ